MSNMYQANDCQRKYFLSSYFTNTPPDYPGRPISHLEFSNSDLCMGREIERKPVPGFCPAFSLSICDSVLHSTSLPWMQTCQSTHPNPKYAFCKPLLPTNLQVQGVHESVLFCAPGEWPRKEAMMSQ